MLQQQAPGISGEKSRLEIQVEITLGCTTEETCMHAQSTWGHRLKFERQRPDDPSLLLSYLQSAGMGHCRLPGKHCDLCGAHRSGALCLLGRLWQQRSNSLFSISGMSPSCLSNVLAALLSYQIACNAWVFYLSVCHGPCLGAQLHTGIVSMLGLLLLGLLVCDWFCHCFLIKFLTCESKSNKEQRLIRNTFGHCFSR